MPQLRRASAILALAALGSAAGQAADPFAQPLPRDRQAMHVVNRLAFGPGRGDIDLVRRIGADAWIRMQLHPERIPQSAELETRLGPLASAPLATWQLFENYQQPQVGPPAASLARLLPAEAIATFQTGAVQARAAMLARLTGEERRRVLLVLPAPAMDGLPELQVEAFNARQAEAERQRRLRPPLMDLITQDQFGILQRGTDDEKTALLLGFEPEKRKHVLRQVAPLSVPPAFRREAATLGQSGQLPLVELIDAKVYRGLYSTRQLEEVLVDFWLNHFNVFSGKGPVRMLLTSYERDAIRPHVFGKFRDMVLATARHPAMLFYLDNWQSQAAPSDTSMSAGPRRAAGLNENYGRELMELHTLGVDGGYTQADVVNVARAFTGWTIHEPDRLGEFFFSPAMHDRDGKVVLGHTIPRGGGEDDGVKVIDILSRHPSTARFIARKLAQRFVADVPPPALVDRVAATFMRTDGDLRAVTETLLLSRELLSEGAWRSKLKSPLEVALSALRAVDADVTDTIVLAQRIGELGQPLYGKSEPTGYPNTSEMWASSAGILGRINLIAALMSGRIPGVKVPEHALSAPDVRRAAAMLLGVEPSPATLGVLTRPSGGVTTSGALASILFASPDFQKR